MIGDILLPVPLVPMKYGHSEIAGRRSCLSAIQLNNAFDGWQLRTARSCVLKILQVIEPERKNLLTIQCIPCGHCRCGNYLFCLQHESTRKAPCSTSPSIKPYSGYVSNKLYLLKHSKGSTLPPAEHLVWPRYRCDPTGLEVASAQPINTWHNELPEKEANQYLQIWNQGTTNVLEASLPVSKRSADILNEHTSLAKDDNPQNQSWNPRSNTSTDREHTAVYASSGYRPTDDRAHSVHNVDWSRKDDGFVAPIEGSWSTARCR